MSHFERIDALPDDCIKIDGYRGHKFENLYYSPSNDAFYQAPKIKFRKLEHGKTCFRCRSDEDKTVRVSIKNVKEQIAALK